MEIAILECFMMGEFMVQETSIILLINTDTVENLVKGKSLVMVDTILARVLKPKPLFREHGKTIKSMKKYKLS